MQAKKIFTIFLIILLCGCSFKKNVNKEADRHLTIETPDISNQVEISEYMQQQFQELNKKGEEIYDSKKYEKYKLKDGTYFMSLNQLRKDFNYDINSIKCDNGKEVNFNESGIYIDTENVLGLKYLEGVKPIIPIIYGCDD